MPACRRKQACSTLAISILTTMMIPLFYLIVYLHQSYDEVAILRVLLYLKLAASISYYEVASYYYKKNRKNRNHNLLKKWREAKTQMNFRQDSWCVIYYP